MAVASLDIGPLRHRLQVQRLGTPTPDAFGALTQNWGVIATRWGRVEPLSGRELFAARQVQADVTHRVTMRYLDGGILPTDRLCRLDGSGNVVQVLNIGDILDQDMQHRVLTLLVKEVV
jgi:SPP1 family predicted phage head-tail adaptor